MRKFILVLSLPFITHLSFSQNKEGAEKLVKEGVAFHDKGDYEGAISRYDKALALDKDNFLALSEKALTLNAMEKYEESVACCKKVIEANPTEKDMGSVYVTYGNAYDGLKKTDKSLEVYDQGIKLFPDYYQLHFNKGVTLASVKKYDEALLSFQKAVVANPKHASSHNAIGRLLYMNSKRIPALLAYGRLLILEPESKRGKEDLESVRAIMKGNVEKTGRKSVTVNISSDMLGDTTSDGKPNENSFTTTDLILAMDAAQDFDKKNKNKTEVEIFIRKFTTVCSSLKETKDKNHGFYWDFYVPYYTEMNDKNLVETFAYIAFATSDDPEVSKWIKSHKAEINKFYDWSKNFPWKTN